jgi:hypothetical protein
MTRNEALEKFVNSDPLQAAWIINEIFDDFEKIKCKNCKHIKPQDGFDGEFICYKVFGEGHIVEPDWFCADFEEKQ